MFRLRFSRSRVWLLASSFDDAGQDDSLESITSAVKRRGYLRREEFLAVCRWKSPRSQPLCALNSAGTIKDVTRFALAPARPDRLKIETLIMLSGVGWPTASVILHFFDRDRYPILDYRALWSVAQELPSPCSYEFWREYTRFTRGLAGAIGCDMRTLDRALWQYSKENQPGGG